MGYLEKKTSTLHTATTNPDLWQRISQFTLDIEGDRLPFSARLARENGWSRQEAQGAIDEYKRFIYLICITDTPLTPSEAVDQVWHLHLVYTRSYWKDFCDGVLGRAIHHDPTKGGDSQTRRFVGQYTRTCALYESEFGSAPPAAFWPSVADRFAAPRLQWVDRRRHWILRKPDGLRGMLRWTAAPLSLLLASTGTLQAESAKQSAGGGFGSLIVFGIIVVIAMLAGRRGKRNNDSSGVSVSGCGGGGGEAGGGGDGGGCGSGCGGGCGGCGG